MGGSWGRSRACSKFSISFLLIRRCHLVKCLVNFFSLKEEPYSGSIYAFSTEGLLLAES